MQPLGTDDPSTVGPYRLIALLGAGGMGKVYLARSAGGRTVAVKVVRPELAGDPGFRERFRREVAAAQSVDGAYTAPVVDADRDSASPWLATAYVLGPTLAEAVAEHGPMPERTVRALGAVLAEALAGIHAAGLVHRDLKPSNVLLAADGPRVIDFGIARALDGSGGTTTGVIVGSPGFMSPEQASGRKVGPVGDVFALGSVLAFAATGQGPFSAGAGDAATLLYRVVHEEPDLARVPEALRPVLAACLTKDPAERPTPAQVLRLLAPEGAAALLRGAWLPAEISGGIARHAAHVMELETPPPSSGRPAADADRRGPVTGTPVPGVAPQELVGGHTRRRLLLGGLSALGVVALGGVGYALAGSGGTPGPAARTSAGPTATPTPTRPPGVAPQPLWTYSASRQLGSPPYLVDGRLLVADSDLTALDPRSGKVAWTGPQISPGIQQRPMALGAGLLLQLDDSNRITAVDPATGAQRWVVPTPPQFGFTALLGANDQTVFVTGQQYPLDAGGHPVISLNSSDSVIVAVDLRTRKVRWVQHRRTANDWEVMGFATATYLVYTNDANDVVARDAGSGAQVWSQTYGDPRATITELPLLGGDTVFLPGAQLLGYGLDQGDQRLKVQASGADSFQALGYADGTVYATYHDSAVAVDAHTGTRRWSVPIVPTVSQAATLVVGPTVFCPVLTGNGTTSGLAALDRATGHTRWTFQDGGSDDNWWMETDGAVLYVTHGERVYALPAS